MEDWDRILFQNDKKGRRDCAFFLPVTRNNAQTLVNGSFVLGIVVRIYKN
jgi:hypothetical protein